MKLDRNINADGRGKYALIKLRRQPNPFSIECFQAGQILKDAGLIDFGDTDDSEFFVIRLKDKYAAAALGAYAEQARKDDPEYGDEILALAEKAATHPNKRRPD